MKARCCCPPERRAETGAGRRREPDALDRLLDRGAVGRGAAPRSRAARNAAGGDDLTDGDRGLDPEPRALGEVADPRAPRARGGRLAEEHGACRACGRSSPSASRSSVVLPPPFGPAMATNSPGSIVEVDVVEDGQAAG